MNAKKVVLHKVFADTPTVKPLNEEQKQAALNIDTSVCLLAGAGCGKTTTLTEHYFELILRKNLKPSEILALSFTEKTASQLKDEINTRLNQNHLYSEEASIYTFHQFCLKIMEESAWLTREDTNLSILGDIESDLFIQEAIESVLLKAFKEDKNILLQTYSYSNIHTQLLEMLQKRDFWRKQEQKKIDSTRSEDYLFYKELRKLFFKVWRTYNKIKIKNKAIDFDDLEEKAFRVLKFYPLVLEQIQKKYKAILIDEFQDTSFSQDQILEKILIQKNTQNDPTHLFIVGDPKQSIYRFRGAEVSLFEKYKQFILKQGGKELYLTINYRSAPSILNWVNETFKDIFIHDPALIAAQNTSLSNDKNNQPSLALEFLDFPSSLKETKKIPISELREKEAILCAQRVKSLLQQGVEANEIYFLFRSNAVMKIYAEALKQENIEVFFRSQLSLWQTQEFFDCYHLLELSLHPFNKNALITLLKNPFLSLSDEAILDSLFQNKAEQKILDWLEQIKQKHLSATQIIWEWIEQSQLLEIYGSHIQLKHKIHNYYQVLNEIHHFELKHGIHLPKLLKHLKKLKNSSRIQNSIEDQLNPESSVQFLTIHQSKGLTLPFVFLPNLYAKPNPFSFTLVLAGQEEIAFKTKKENIGFKEKLEKSPFLEKIVAEIKQEEEAEEQRIYYVAMTRAVNKLILGFMPPEAYQATFLQKKIAELSESFKKVNSTNHDEIEKIQAIRDDSNQEINIKNNLHKEKIILKTPPPRCFGISKLESFLKSKQFYAERYLLKLATDEIRFKSQNDHSILQAKENIDPLIYGEIIHELFFRALSLKQALTLKSVNEIASKKLIEMSKKQAEHLWQTFQTCMEDPLFQSKIKNKKLAGETPFFIHLKNGILEGVIDLVIEDEESICILDYKSHQNLEQNHFLETAHSYTFQMKSYCLALNKVFQRKKVYAKLYFIELKRFYDFYFSEEDLAAHEKQLTELISDIHLFEENFYANHPQNS